MKNFLVFAIFTALVFVVSCGGGSSSDNNSVANFGKLGQECYPNKSCDEGLLCEEETNRCIEDPENPSNSDNENSDNDSIENNDSNPVEENDKDDQPIDNNDTDDIIDDNDPINNNDSDDVIDDNDPINHNDSDDVIDDNDNNPSEHDDTDNTNDSYGLFAVDCIALKEDLENLTQAQIDDIKRQGHDKARELCPYNYIQQPERYDEWGSMCIVDKCEGNLDEPMWLEGATRKILYDVYGVLPPVYQKTVSMTFNYSVNGSQSNVKIKTEGLLLDVNFVSQSCLSQTDENTSVITHDSYYGCHIDGEYMAPPIETKSAKQTRTLSPEYRSLCKSMPNYQIDEYNNLCSTTINEFVWLENVVSKLFPKNSYGFWPSRKYAIKSITRDLDTGVFHMTMQIGSDPVSAMKVSITLNNAKSCIDQCHGKEGCTSHIETTRQDASKGCFINGVEVNGEE